MNTKDNLKINVLLAVLVTIGIATRFLSHTFDNYPPNFTAIGAIALFSGAYFKNRKLAYVLPLAILFLSDLLLGLHSTMIFVYLSFAFMIYIGSRIQKDKSVLKIAGSSILGSLVFFLITNFGVWATGMGLHTNLSLVLIDGIPFFRNMLVGDLFFNAIFFGAAYFIFEKSGLFATANERI